MVYRIIIDGYINIIFPDVLVYFISNRNETGLLAFWFHTFSFYFLEFIK